MTETYSISEAAAVTSKHPNTIRLKIRLGQLRADVSHGKFGEEYRIPHAALVEAGLLAGEADHSGEAGGAPYPAPAAPDTGDAEWAAGEAVGAAGVGGEPASTSSAPLQSESLTGSDQAGLAASLSALTALYQRHEQAMFRLGYLQGELERFKALEETAESLRDERDSREAEARNLRAAAEERDRLRQQAEAREAEARESLLATETERDRLRQECQARETEARALRAAVEERDRLRGELHSMQSRLTAAEERSQRLDALQAELTELQSRYLEQDSELTEMRAAAARRWWHFRRN